MLSGLFKNATINNADTTSAAKFNLWRCGNINAFELIFPLNLPNATTEPVKVTAPIKIPKNTSTLWIFVNTACSATNAAFAAASNPSGINASWCKP